MKKMISVGIRMNIPNPQDTQSGRDAISPIRISEVIWSCPVFGILLIPRSATPKNSLRSNRIITGLIDASKASSNT